MIKPKVSYAAALDFYDTYDIKFRSLQTDTCDYCSTQIHLAHNGISDIEKSEAKRLLQIHQREAAACYAQKTKDIRDAKTIDKVETIEIDLAQANRTPFVQQGSAFFKMMKCSYNYIITQASTNKNYCYLYDETMVDKGPNMVCSCFLKWVSMWIAANTVNGVRRILDILNIWCDGCPTQVWNNYTVFFITLLSEPWSPYYISKRVDLQRGRVGHTYLGCDKNGGYVNRQALVVHRNQLSSGVITTFQAELGDLTDCTSWEAGCQ